ncbi:hypothetical protein PFISCL1PPCAC_25003, partial [Pristionchus fissidentatus]
DSITSQKIGIGANEVIQAECVIPCTTDKDDAKILEIEVRRNMDNLKFVRCKTSVFPRAIELRNRERHDFLTCENVEGWKDNKGTMIEDAGIQLELACPEYCGIEKKSDDTEIRYKKLSEGATLFCNSHDF